MLHGLYIHIFPADAYLAAYGVLPGDGGNDFAPGGAALGRVIDDSAISESPRRNLEGVDAADGEGGQPEDLEWSVGADGARRVLALAQAMHSICANTPAPDGSGPIRIRVGLHVGPAIAAVVGTQMLRCAGGHRKLLVTIRWRKINGGAPRCCRPVTRSCEHAPWSQLKNGLHMSKKKRGHVMYI